MKSLQNANGRESLLRRLLDSFLGAVLQSALQNDRHEVLAYLTRGRAVAWQHSCRKWALVVECEERLDCCDVRAREKRTACARCWRSTTSTALARSSRVELKRKMQQAALQSLGNCRRTALRLDRTRHARHRNRCDNRQSLASARVTLCRSCCRRHALRKAHSTACCT